MVQHCLDSLARIIPIGSDTFMTDLVQWPIWTIVYVDEERVTRTNCAAADGYESILPHANSWPELRRLFLSGQTVINLDDS